MDEAFKQFVETLHPSFERLMQMAPLRMAALPSKLPEKCIYLLSENQNHLYVGRTRRRTISASPYASTDFYV